MLHAVTHQAQAAADKTKAPAPVRSVILWVLVAAVMANPARFAPPITPSRYTGSITITPDSHTPRSSFLSGARATGPVIASTPCGQRYRDLTRAKRPKASPLEAIAWRNPVAPNASLRRPGFERATGECQRSKSPWTSCNGGIMQL